MSKVFKVKTAAVFNGQPPGSIIELKEETARKYEALKYVEIIEEVKPVKKATSAPKKPAKTSAKKSTTPKKKTEK